MKELNCKFRGRDKATDVLSFSLESSGADEFPGDAGPWGEIYICPEVAGTNASTADRTLQSEIEHLMLHGLLHILRYDHKTPDEYQRMTAMEKKILLELQGEKT